MDNLESIPVGVALQQPHYRRFHILLIAFSTRITKRNATEMQVNCIQDSSLVSLN